MKPFAIRWQNALPHGIVVGVALPEVTLPFPPNVDVDALVPRAVLERLHPAEREAALALHGFRRIQFVGGRLAVRAACAALAPSPGPILRDARGAPRCPDGLTVSISHKRHTAVGLAALGIHGSVGVDFEDLEPPREHLAPKVLTAAELLDVKTFAPERRWTSILLRFSIKEAIYKALAPRLARYIGFEEAEVQPRPDGTARVRLHLAGGDGPQALDARYHWLEDSVLATVRARWD